MNKISLVGRLTDRPELKQTPSGVNVTSTEKYGVRGHYGYKSTDDIAQKLDIGCAKTADKETLCWSCARAAAPRNMACSWSDGSFRPVEGWTASERTLYSSNRRLPGVKSFYVEKCPLYLHDGRST